MFFMRWYVLVSLMSDSRIKFLLWFVVVAIIVAIVLILIEVNLKRKKERNVSELVNESPIEKMRKSLRYNKDFREKLDFIDKTAKEYFKEVYGTHLNSNYSKLIKEFEKHHRKNEAAFCNAMFEAYYSYDELSNDRIIALGDMLVGIENKKKRAEEISRVPTFMERLLSFFGKVENIFLKREREGSVILRVNKTERRNVVPIKKQLKSDVNTKIYVNQASGMNIKFVAVMGEVLFFIRKIGRYVVEKFLIFLDKIKVLSIKKRGELIGGQKQFFDVKKQKEMRKEIEKKRLRVLERQRALGEKKVSGGAISNDVIIKNKPTGIHVFNIQPKAVGVDTKNLTHMSSGFIDNIKSFFTRAKNKSFVNGGESRESKIIRNNKQKTIDWVREAIKRKYGRKEVLNLLSDGKRSLIEIKEVLRVYDDEISKKKREGPSEISDKKESSGVAGDNKMVFSSLLKDLNEQDNKAEISGDGVAERIIKREKDRLDRKGFLKNLGQ